jgi:hypothetical protein
MVVSSHNRPHFNHLDCWLIPLLSEDPHRGVEKVEGR